MGWCPGQSNKLGMVRKRKSVGFMGDESRRQGSLPRVFCCPTEDETRVLDVGKGDKEKIAVDYLVF